MKRCIAAGLVALVLAWMPGAGAAGRVYAISGSLSAVENACTQIVYLLGGGDCSYGGNRPNASGVYAGPTQGAAYYPVGSAGDSLTPSGSPVAPLLAGTLTLDDGGTITASDDNFSGQFIVGATARATATGQSTRAVERWETFTLQFGATGVSSASANASGGFDYVIGSKGFPQLIAAFDDPSVLYPSPAATGGLGTDSCQEGPPVQCYWAGPEPAGIGFEASTVLNGPAGNIGIAPASSVTGYSCNDQNGTDCTASPILFGPAGTAAWTNLVLRVSTNAQGEVTTARAFWSKEYRINFGSPPPGNNSWAGGLLEFAGVPEGAQAGDDTAAVPANSGATALNVLANDLGFGNPVTVTLTAEPEHGTAVVTGSPGNPALVRIEYTPEPGYAGPDSLQYGVTDGEQSDEATLAITVVAPEALDDAAQTQIGSPVAIDVLANDSGFSQPVTVTVLSGPGHGTAQVANSPGQAGSIRIAYTPAAGYSGADSLSYQVTDGVNTASATVAITVLSFNAQDDSFVLLSECCYQTLNVLKNDVGFAGQVTVNVIQAPSRGSYYVSGSPGVPANVSIQYYPDYYNVPATYTTTLKYQVSDGAHTDTATVTIKVVDYMAVDDQAVTAAGTPVSIAVADNDVGFDWPRTVGVFTNPQHGSLQIINGPYYYDDPVVIYTPAPGFLGVDSFEYAIETGSAQVDTALVTIQVITDADLDQVDDGLDNCLGAANTDQRDGDGDGYGTWCDADFNNDGRVNFADLSDFRIRFGTKDPAADFNGDGVVSLLDLGRFKALFGGTPGPSALTP